MFIYVAADYAFLTFCSLDSEFTGFITFSFDFSFIYAVVLFIFLYIFYKNLEFTNFVKWARNNGVPK